MTQHVIGESGGHQFDFTVDIKRLTNRDLVFTAAKTTSWNKVKARGLEPWYRCEHSPIRTQMFYISTRGIPHFAHTHFVRHTVWNQPFVRTGREDRGKKGVQTRWSPNDMDLLVNAQTLINMARKRLCRSAHEVAQKIMGAIVDEMRVEDVDLSRCLVRECIYRNGFCPQFKPCGFLQTPEALDELQTWLGSDWQNRIMFHYVKAMVR